MVAWGCCLSKRIAQFLPESVNLADVKRGAPRLKGNASKGRIIEATWENEKVRDIRLRIGLEGGKGEGGTAFA